jgi:hypothetical protein
MYVAEIISCSNNNYWYKDYIGEFFDIIGNIYEYDVGNLERILITDYLSGNVKVNINYKIWVNNSTIGKTKINTMLVNVLDVKIHNIRKLKLKQFRNAM